jgi:hypothetical protein
MISTGGASATVASALSATHNNAINAGYGGSQAFDNDDGVLRVFPAGFGLALDAGAYAGHR